MDSEKMKLRTNNEHVDVDKEGEGGGKTALPGFRFHPTDQELVGFYLRRKVDGKPLAIDLIKQIDIYKYDPWDLPRDSDLGDNEWYFFCKRGRKYRNSIRPNRVTASGFWKATGIDRPIYSPSGSICIGLKKSLVYYRGSAGKGTKTQWMMHEFRLPPSSHNHMDDKSLYQEAEVWTLCRILKRNGCQRKTSADWRDLAAKRNNTVVDSSSKTCSADSDQDLQSYISFQAPVIQHYQHHSHLTLTDGMVNMRAIDQFTSSLVVSDEAPSASASNSSVSGLDGNRFIDQGDWDDLRSAIDQFAAADRPVFFL